jgi:hypothetical protein
MIAIGRSALKWTAKCSKAGSEAMQRVLTPKGQATRARIIEGAAVSSSTSSGTRTSDSAGMAIRSA